MKSDAGEMNFGLKAATVARITSVFAGHARVQQVIIYGSRAKGNYRNGSDIDLTIKGEGITLSELMKIETELDDLMLPYKIDLSLLHKINDADLIDHIRRIGRVFYDRSGEAAPPST